MVVGATNKKWKHQMPCSYFLVSHLGCIMICDLLLLSQLLSCLKFCGCTFDNGGEALSCQVFGLNQRALVMRGWDQFHQGGGGHVWIRRKILLLATGIYSPSSRSPFFLTYLQEKESIDIALTIIIGFLSVYICLRAQLSWL